MFTSLIQHILNEIIITTDEDKSVNKKLYFEYFSFIYEKLASNPKEIKDVKNAIIYTVKQLIYKNVDNQSFRNPVTLYIYY